ncbi:hypothetical protein JCM16106_19170 [Hydrogenophilus islandicus]
MRSMRGVIAGVAMLMWLPIAHAEWVTVAKDREREVQVDTETILPAEAGIKVAWGRVVFTPAEAERLGFFAIRALNRFDCQKRTFTTVKRVYLNREELPIREEMVAEQQAVPVVKGSVDERLWRAVCQPASPQELKQAAEQALQSAKSAMEPKGGKEPLAAEERKGGATPQAGAAGAGAGSTSPIPIGVDLADPSQLPPEIASQPVPNLLPPKGKETKPGGVPPVAAPAVGSATPAPAAPTEKTQVQNRLQLPSRQAEDKSAPKSAPQAASQKSTPSPGESPKSRPPSPPATAAAPKLPAPKSSPSGTKTPPVTRRGALPPPEAWRYEGAGGADQWHQMSREWRLCKEGRRQAPIALAGAIAAEIDFPQWRVHPAWYWVERTPRGEIVLTPTAAQTLLWRGRLWQLERASWHHPVLHPGRPGGSWVGSWLLTWVAEGERLLVELPVAQGERTAPELAVLAEWVKSGGKGVRIWWDWRSLLPVDDSFTLYEGSEPWPPCREGVVWLVYRNGSEAEGSVVAPLIAGPRTSRPPQPAHGRLVVEVAR